MVLFMQIALCSLAFLVGLGPTSNSAVLLTTDAPPIKLRNGFISGAVLQNVDTKVKYFSYRGIPYALPPVGERRFEPPEPLPETAIHNWNGVREYKKYAPGCLALDHYKWHSENGQKWYEVTGREDCLYLNVHSRDVNEYVFKPVIFFIHGGGFSFGSPAQFDPELIMIRPEAVIVVDAAYRLGPLGFFSTDDGAVPGNNGLKDQVLALQWVKNNIRLFGGDVNRITLNGVDAGASMVHFMYFSSSTMGLFNGGISHSGTAINPWALMKTTTMRERSFWLARQMNCFEVGSVDMVNCMKKKNAVDIVSTTRLMKSFYYNPFAIFAPVMDSVFPQAFFDGHPLQLMLNKNIRHVPWMLINTEYNANYPMAEFLGQKDRIDELKRRWANILPSILFYNESCRDVAIALKTDFNIPITEKYHQPLLNYVSDHNFFEPARVAQKLMSIGSNAKIYYGLFRYNGSSSTASLLSDIKPPNSLGVSNGDDVAYVYLSPNVKLINTKEDQLMSHLLTHIEVTFAGTLAPPPSVNWIEALPNKQNLLVFNSHDTKDLTRESRGPQHFISMFDYLYQDPENEHCRL